MKTVKLRGVTIGSGSPKIIVPIVGKTREEILDKGTQLTAIALHMVEWRVDFYENAKSIPDVLDTLKALRAVLKEIPLLFTFRTAKEGGEKEISMGDYTRLNQAVALSGDADAIDIEIFSGDEVVMENIANIHAAGKVVVASSHDFHKTPDKDDLVARLRKMQNMGADIPKIAVMPQSTADVLTLLSATEEMSRCYADRPIMTMSMSATGVISRLCGEVFGSALTFGAFGQVSAPGQIQVEQLNAVIQTIHNAL